jgi:tetratricopeptide (TPR) repeat protein
LIRLFVPGLLLAALTARTGATEPGQLDGSPALFTVLAAINAAGYDAELSSTNNHPLRAQVRQALAAKDIPSLPALRAFYVAHRRDNPTADLSQYISFALSVDGPPAFKFKSRAVELPPDVAPLADLGPLMAAFYKEAGIDDLWKGAQPAFDQALERYHEPTAEAVLAVNSYLRNETSGMSGRRFQIYIDLLGAPNQIQTRSYANDYYVVVTPSAEPRIHDVRHAYLHFLLDPLATRHEEIIMRKRGLADHAQRAAALDASFKSDFLLLVTESLIQAIESRLDHKPAAVDEAMHQGYILTAYFAGQLPAYQKQEQAMRFYFPEMVMGIDLVKEDARLSQIEFSSTAPVRQVAVPPPPPPPPLTGAAKTLDEAEDLYTGRKLDEARLLYLRALEETADKPLQARAYYGLARIAALQKNPELAERMFEKTLESSPEPPVHAWALVYLGRLSDAAGDPRQALERYKQALAVDGASAAAHQAAAAAVERSSQKSN